MRRPNHDYLKYVNKLSDDQTKLLNDQNELNIMFLRLIVYKSCHYRVKNFYEEFNGLSETIDWISNLEIHI